MCFVSGKEEPFENAQNMPNQVFVHMRIWAAFESTVGRECSEWRQVNGGRYGNMDCQRDLMDCNQNEIMNNECFNDYYKTIRRLLAAFANKAGYNSIHVHVAQR